MKRYLFLFFLVTFSLSAFGWGKSGHDAIVYIAEQNISPKTKKIVEKYLDGRSIVYFASWPDQIRFDESFKGDPKKFAHVAYYTADGKAICDESKTKPDAIVQITRLMDELGRGQYRKCRDSLVTEAIKYLVHAVGDMHCPCHVKREGKKDGMKVKYFGKPMKYHTVWDSGVVDTWHQWSYLEYGHQLSRLDAKTVAELTAGSVKDWGEDAARRTACIWDWAAPGDELGKPFVYKAGPLADEMIQIAGYRLAKVLDCIFLSK